MGRVFSAFLCVFTGSIHAQPRDSDFEMLEAESRWQPSLALELGYALTGTPQAGIHYEFQRGWQLGAEVRSWAHNAKLDQDYFPEATFHFRRLWLAAEEGSPLRNSEYIDLAFGIFPAYNFGRTGGTSLETLDSDALGYKPMIRASIGKYWMPFSNIPFGLDANIVLGRYLSGHPPLYPHQDLLTMTFSLFWKPNRLPGI
jgi:hypothetical protein